MLIAAFFNLEHIMRIDDEPMVTWMGSRVKGKGGARNVGHSKLWHR